MTTIITSNRPRDGPTGQAAFEISLSLSKIDFKKHHANLRSCLLLTCRPRSVDASTWRHGESEQQAENRRMAGRMKCPSGWMTVRADSGVASFLIPKTVQNGIRGCFISHPQKFSYIRLNVKLLTNHEPSPFHGNEQLE
jgi:hypothetical protein